MTKTESVLRWIAFGCAVFLLLGPLGGRTVVENGNTIITDSAAYNIVAVFSGVVAIVGLGIVDRPRPRVVFLVVGAPIAVVAFGLTAWLAGLFALPLLRGEVMVDGGSIMKFAPNVYRLTVHHFLRSPLSSEA